MSVVTSADLVGKGSIASIHKRLTVGNIARYKEAVRRRSDCGNNLAAIANVFSDLPALGKVPNGLFSKWANKLRLAFHPDKTKELSPGLRSFARDMFEVITKCINSSMLWLDAWRDNRRMGGRFGNVQSRDEWFEGYRRFVMTRGKRKPSKKEQIIAAKKINSWLKEIKARKKALAKNYSKSNGRWVKKVTGSKSTALIPAASSLTVGSTDYERLIDYYHLMLPSTPKWSIIKQLMVTKRKALANIAEREQLPIPPHRDEVQINAALLAEELRSGGKGNRKGNQFVDDEAGEEALELPGPSMIRPDRKRKEMSTVERALQRRGGAIRTAGRAKPSPKKQRTEKAVFSKTEPGKFSFMAGTTSGKKINGWF